MREGRSPATRGRGRWFPPQESRTSFHASRTRPVLRTRQSRTRKSRSPHVPAQQVAAPHTSAYDRRDEQGGTTHEVDRESSERRQVQNGRGRQVNQADAAEADDQLERVAVGRRQRDAQQGSECPAVEQ